MITIVLNGDSKAIGNKTNIEQLLQSLNLENNRLAVEINHQIIPRSNFSKYTFNESDQVEIVQAIGGG